MPQPTRYIAFLAAVNVGKRIVKMERLRGLFSDLGLENVRSYITSGNVFFETTAPDREALTERIQAHLERELGFHVDVLLRTEAEVQRIVDLDPFRDVVVTPIERLLVVFVSEPLPVGVELPLVSPKGDAEVISATEGAIFVVLHQHEGKPVNAGPFLAKAFKGGKQGKATTRFFGAMVKILNAAKAGWSEASSGG